MADAVESTALIKKRRGPVRGGLVASFHMDSSGGFMSPLAVSVPQSLHKVTAPHSGNSVLFLLVAESHWLSWNARPTWSNKICP